MCPIARYPIGAAAGYRRRASRLDGAILLEVVLALTVFAGAAGVVFSGLSASFVAAERVMIDAQAADLAVTTLSEIMLGERELTDAGPEDFEDEDLAGWQWQIVVEPMEAFTVLETEELQVQVIIRHAESGRGYRLVRLMPSVQAQAEAEEMMMEDW